MSVFLKASTLSLTLLLQFAAGLQQNGIQVHDNNQDFPWFWGEDDNEGIEAEQGQEPELRFVSVNTEGDLAITAGGFPEPVHNVGEGKTWKGYGTKLLEILTYTDTLPDDALLVYIDGNDVVWGGCSKKQFIANYRRIRHLSGAPIVVGAELVCGEQSCENSTALPDWVLKRDDKQRMLITRHSRMDFTECDEQVKSECRCDMPSEPKCRNFNYTGVDDTAWNLEQQKQTVSLLQTDTEPMRRGENAAEGQTDGERVRKGAGMKFRFINSGFIMGPASAVRDMFAWAVFHYLSIKEDKSWMHDQAAIAEYWRLNPKLVALDYRGELALSLPRLATNVLSIEQSETSGNNVAMNRMRHGDVQCLIHNNINEWNGGDRANYWWDFFERLTPNNKDWA